MKRLFFILILLFLVFPVYATWTGDPRFGQDNVTYVKDWRFSFGAPQPCFEISPAILTASPSNNYFDWVELQSFDNQTAISVGARCYQVYSGIDTIRFAIYSDSLVNSVRQIHPGHRLYQCGSAGVVMSDTGWVSQDISPGLSLSYGQWYWVAFKTGTPPTRTIYYNANWGTKAHWYQSGSNPMQGDFPIRCLATNSNISAWQVRICCEGGGIIAERSIERRMRLLEGMVK